MNKTTKKVSRISEKRESFEQMLLTLGYELAKPAAIDFMDKTQGVINVDCTVECLTLGFAKLFRDDMILKHNAEYGEIDIKNFN